MSVVVVIRVSVKFIGFLWLLLYIHILLCSKINIRRFTTQNYNLKCFIDRVKECEYIGSVQFRHVQLNCLSCKYIIERPVHLSVSNLSSTLVKSTRFLDQENCPKTEPKYACRSNGNSTSRNQNVDRSAVIFGIRLN